MSRNNICMDNERFPSGPDSESESVLIVPIAASMFNNLPLQNEAVTYLSSILGESWNVVALIPLKVNGPSSNQVSISCEL